MFVNSTVHTFASQPNQLNITTIFLILSLLLINTYEKVVYQDLFGNFQNSWEVYTLQNCENIYSFQNCDDKEILYIKQCQFNVLIFKTIELQPHYEVKLDLKFLRVNYPNNREFIIYIDGKIEHQQVYSNSNNFVDRCTYDHEYLIFPISFTIQHSSSSVTISMCAENQLWGITEFQLSINECSIGCNSCNQQGCFNQELFFKLFNSKIFSTVNQEEGWQTGHVTVNQIQECLGIFKCDYIGFNYLVSSGGHIVKVFELNQHYVISFQVKLLIFNSQSTQIHIYLDDKLVFTTNYIYEALKFQGYICDYISMQEINIFQYHHFGTELKIAIQVDLNQMNYYNNLSTYIGIRDFQLFVKIFDGCLDKNIFPFDGCFSNNFDCNQGCGNCIKGICQDCLNGWEFQELRQQCIPFCGDSIIIHDEECDDGNLIAYDGCHNCKYSCPKYCRFCEFGICLKCKNYYLLLEGKCLHICEELENTYLEENQGCFNFLIREGYQPIQLFDNQFQHFILTNINLLSLTLYDDLLSQEIFEQQHRHLIFEYCKVVSYGRCLECLAEYELDFLKINCIPKCQDEIKLLQEVCDDGNKIQFDGCYKCQKSCQIECLFCSYNKCYNCQDGWQLQDYQCEQICGDGQLAILSIEQCDNPEDSNCVDCQYQCDHNCLTCDKFQNCEICLHPFEKKDGKCQPICGDTIITPIFEQCDDGNDILYDGCYQCQYQCSFGCIKCEQDNHCVLCEDQYYILDMYTFLCKELSKISDPEPVEEIDDIDLLTFYCKQNQAFINDECVDLCGNGILNSQFEQCDDGNIYGGDGCSALCFEEDSYKCINQENQLSICTFIQVPNFNLIFLSDKQNQTKIFELSFSQEVYLFSDQLFEKIVEFIIIPQTQYALSMTPVINISSQLSHPKYQISIEFLKPVEEPILQINIQKFSIFNEFDLELINNSKKISLGTPFVLSGDTQQRVIQVIKMNDALVYSAASIAGLLFLTGNYIVFFNLLDLLQSLSYIRYMQYNFPPHLNQFLETYTKISLQPILDSLRVDELIATFIGSTQPSQGKESQQSKQTNFIDQLYLINAKGCFFSYFVSIVTYFTCYLISSNMISEWIGQYFKNNENNIKTLRLISIFQKKIQSKCQRVKNYYFSLGIFQLFYSTLHQLLFSTLLQFPKYTFNSIFEIINTIAALGSLLFLIQILFRILSITSSQIKDKTKWKYFFQDLKTEFWAANFKSFQIFRTFFYITVIAKLIQYPEAQSVLLSMQSFFYLIYLIVFKPLKSNLEIAKLVCREATLLIITGSFLVYSLKLNNDQILFYGWFHIALFCCLMGFTLSVDILDQGQKAYYFRLKKIQTQEQKKILQYYNNPLQQLIQINNLDQQQNK